MGAKISTGATISFSTGFFATITSMSWSGLTRESRQSSHMGTTTAHTFLPSSLYDPGELSVDLEFAAETIPPIVGAMETVTITLPSDGAGGTSTWAASGFLTSFEWTAPLEDIMTATATIKFSGVITVVA